MQKFDLFLGGIADIDSSRVISATRSGLGGIGVGAGGNSVPGGGFQS